MSKPPPIPPPRRQTPPPDVASGNQAHADAARPSQPEIRPVAQESVAQESVAQTGARPLVDIDTPFPGPANREDTAKANVTLFSMMGGYRVVELLGEGAMGKVYLAEHEVLRRPAAIKVLHKEHANPDAVERFFTEARAASNIDHPGIVKVYDVGENDEGAYLVMELLEGESLEDRLRRVGELDVRDSARFAVQIASALEAAHANGIIHRDLKPGNLFITKDAEVSGGERIKILDFGIAKVTDAANPMVTGPEPKTNKTQSGMLLGSPTYMSPEQCRGAETVDQRADLYSLGCILFEMLCGRPPFDHQVVAAVLAAHLREEPPAPSSIRPELSPQLDAVVLRLLAKDADARYQSAEAFTSAMVREAGHTLILQTGVTHTLVRMTHMFVSSRKRRWLSGLAVVALLAVGSLGIVMQFRGGDARGASASPAAVDEPLEPVVVPLLPPAKRPVMNVRMLADTGRDEDPDESNDVVVDGLAQPESRDGPVPLTLLENDVFTLLETAPDFIELNADKQPLVTWRIETQPPGAQVTYDDGTPLSADLTTPLSVKFAAVAGAENLKVMLEGHEVERIPVRFDTFVDKKLTLERYRVVEVVTEPAGVTLYRPGGTVIGSSPRSFEVRRGSDKRRVIARLEGHEQEEVAIGPGMPDPAVLVMRPYPAFTIESVPSRTPVFVDETQQGVTPLSLVRSRADGPMTVTLRRDGYEQGSLVVDPGKPAEARTLSATLMPLQRVEIRTNPRKASIRDPKDGQVYESPYEMWLSRQDSPRALLISAGDEYEEQELIVGPSEPDGFKRLERTLRVDLPRIPKLKVESKPRKVHILGPGGEDLGLTPQRFPVSSRPGTLALTLRADGYEDLAIVLRHDERPPRRYELVALPTVKLKTTPSRAGVYDASGEKLGETPMTVTVAENDGPREFVLKKAGYQDQRVTVRPGQELPRRIELARLATIRIESRPPGATVFDDSGAQVGVTPFVISVPRSRDTLRFKLEREGHEPAGVTVVPKRDRTERVSLEPLPEQVTIVIVTKPAGATVTVGHQVVGTTPYTVTRLESSGRTEYKLRLEGHQPDKFKLKNDESRRETRVLEECDKPSPEDVLEGIDNPYWCRDE